MRLFEALANAVLRILNVYVANYSECAYFCRGMAMK